MNPSLPLLPSSPRALQCRTRAFTLVELLVVISIILVLGALAFPAIQGALDRAKKVEAKNNLIQIITAVTAFNTEYGRYPVDPASAGGSDAFFGNGTAPSGSNSAGGIDVLVDVLRNATQGPNTATVAALNPKRIPFMSVPQGWGAAYNVVVDANYNDELANPYPDTDGSAGAAQLRGTAIAYSVGKDGTKGTKGPPANANFKKSDDVLSWQ